MITKDPHAPLMVRFDSLADLPPAPPLSKAVKAMSDAEIERRTADEENAGAVPAYFWTRHES
jgi:hypothetical protein